VRGSGSKPNPRRDKPYDKNGCPTRGRVRGGPSFARILATWSQIAPVNLNIQAKPERVWSLLTDAERFPTWNSTVTRIEGRIRDGQKLRIHVPGTTRTFAPTVSNFVPNQHMTWTGGFAPMFLGVRTFDLSPRNDGSTDFKMHERFSGLMLPMVGGSLPDFGPIFTTYATDLKKEAEKSGS
jgi:hypothetical protein